MSQYRSNWSFHIPLKIYLRHLTICWARGYSIYVGLCSLCSRLRKGAGDWYWWGKGNESGERRSPFPALFALFSLSPCPSSVLRLQGRVWATWVCAAQQGMVFAPLALKQRIKNTLLSLLSLLSLPKNRWHYGKTTLLPPSEFFSFYKWCQGQSCKLKQAQAQSLKNSAAHLHGKFQWVPSPISPNPALPCRLEFKVRPWFGIE